VILNPVPDKFEAFRLPAQAGFFMPQIHRSQGIPPGRLDVDSELCDVRNQQRQPAQPARQRSRVAGEWICVAKHHAANRFTGNKTQNVYDPVTTFNRGSSTPHFHQVKARHLAGLF
jgi:hypothetical protein